eukprot:11066809-Heterocapsa_arctica.AAC.1
MLKGSPFERHFRWMLTLDTEQGSDSGRVPPPNTSERVFPMRLPFPAARVEYRSRSKRAAGRCRAMDKAKGLVNSLIGFFSFWEAGTPKGPKLYVDLPPLSSVQRAMADVLLDDVWGFCRPDGDPIPRQ